MGFWAKVESYLEEVLEIKTSPYSIALGFAVGTLIAVLPTFGLGVFIGLIVIFLFKRISKIALFAAFVVWNPFVLIFTTILSYYIGDFIIGDLPVRTFKFELLNQIFVYSRRYLLGNLMLSIVLSLLSYLVVYYLARAYQKRASIEKSIKKELSRI